MTVLPRGIRDGIADAVFRGDAWGLIRAANIAAGFTLAAWGYATASRTRAKATTVPAFTPMRVIEVDVNAPLPTLEARDPKTGAIFGGALALVRRGNRAVGVLELPSLPATITAEMIESIEPAADDDDRARGIDVTQDLPAVSIVVATRDRQASLAKTLDSLLAQDYPNFDVVVVDSAPSSNETATMIAELYRGTGRVRYIRTDQPGLGHAHNCGMTLVSAPIVAFTDDDVVADRRWLSAIAENFIAGDNVGCVTGLILPAELETRAQFWTERHGAFGKGFARKVYDTREHRPPGALFPFTAGQFGSGANMAYRTDALRAVGGFDAALGAGTKARSGDDLLAFYDIVTAGYQLVYEPQAIIWHYHRRQEDGMRRQAFGYGMGLGAYLTKVVIDDPAAALRLARALPSGLRHMWGSSSDRMQRLPADYPRNLVWRERLGVLAGPLGYLRSIIAVRSRRGAAPRTGGETLAGSPEAS